MFVLLDACFNLFGIATPKRFFTPSQSLIYKRLQKYRLTLPDRTVCLHMISLALSRRVCLHSHKKMFTSLVRVC